MKTLLVPMHGPIGSLVMDFVAENLIERVFLVHPWKEKSPAHHNAIQLAAHFDDSILRRLKDNIGSGLGGPERVDFEVKALNCSESLMAIAERFQWMVLRDRQETSSGFIPEYLVLITEETPLGYTFGAMALSGSEMNINCYIGSVGYDIRKPRVNEFRPERRIVETIRRVPLLGHISESRAWLGRRSGTRAVFKLVHLWYQENPDRWAELTSFRTKDIEKFSSAQGEQKEQSLISTHIGHMIRCEGALRLVEARPDSSVEYRITSLGRLIGWELMDNIPVEQED